MNAIHFLQFWQGSRGRNSFLSGSWVDHLPSLAIATVAIILNCCGQAFLLAQDAAEPPLTEVDKRLAKIEAQFQTAYEEKAGAEYKKQVTDLNAKYLDGLDREMAKVSKAGNLEAAILIRKEKELIEDGEELPPNDEALPTRLKSLRATFRNATARFKAERDRKAKPLYQAYEKALASYQTELTQQQQIDAALKVETRRREVAKLVPSATVGGKMPLAEWIEGTRWRLIRDNGRHGVMWFEKNNRVAIDWDKGGTFRETWASEKPATITWMNLFDISITITFSDSRDKGTYKESKESRITRGSITLIVD